MNNKIKIKFESFWTKPDKLTDVYNTLTKNNNYIWNDLEINHNDYDYVIIQGSTKNKNIDPTKSIVIQCEPKCYRNQIYSDYYRNDEKDYNRFKVFFDIERFHPVDHWILDATYNDVIHIDSNNKINNRMFSIFSGKTLLQGHKDRIFFMKNFLDNVNFFDLYMSSTYSQIHKHGNYVNDLKSFRSILPSNFYPYSKYKYTFQVENSYEKNYFTQVAIRPIICECLMFYSGCPNLEEFIHPKCFIYVNLNKPDEALEIIYKSIYDNEWEKRIDYIKRQKKILMNDNNALNIIESLIKTGEFKWKTL